MPRAASRKAQMPRPSWWNGSSRPLKRTLAPTMSFSNSLLKPFVALVRKSASRMGSMTSASSHDDSPMKIIPTTNNDNSETGPSFTRTSLEGFCWSWLLLLLADGFSGSHAYFLSHRMFFFWPLLFVF